jgi:hypothetical protein
MSQRLLPPQVRGQRISQAELLEEARTALEELGVNNLLQAEYIAELAKAVVKDSQPILCQQRPKVRPVKDKFWKYGFTLVREYLAEMNLALTQQTAEIEFPPFTSESIGLSHSSSTERITEVLGMKSDQPFADRVGEHFSATKAEQGQPAEAVSAFVPEAAVLRPQKKRAPRADSEKAPTPKLRPKTGKVSRAKGAVAKGQQDEGDAGSFAD